MAAPRVAYLHGFASGPGSRKAQFFRERLAERGVELLIPQLDGGEFERLTITRELEVVRRLAEGGEIVLIGSSMGGYLAALYAAGHLNKQPNVKRLILLAPAFNFAALWAERLGAQSLAAWQAQGSMEVYHYGSGGKVPLGFDLYADAVNYPPFPDFPQPTLLLHGRNDDSVPLAQSQWIAAKRPNVELVELDAGHEMTEVLPEIWRKGDAFLRDLFPLQNRF